MCVCVQDVVYFFQPQEDCLVTVATCNSAQFTDTFDTVLYVLSNAVGPAAMEVIGCNDDACSYLSQLQVSACTCMWDKTVWYNGFIGNSSKTHEPTVVLMTHAVNRLSKLPCKVGETLEVAFSILSQERGIDVL